MNEQPTDFSDFVTDKDGDYSEARFLQLANELVREGRRPHRVFLAMYRAASSAALEHSIYEYYQLTKVMHDDLTEFMPELEAKLDSMISDRKQ